VVVLGGDGVTVRRTTLAGANILDTVNDNETIEAHPNSTEHSPGSIVH
jgi:hypothetical protein